MSLIENARIRQRRRRRALGAVLVPLAIAGLVVALVGQGSSSSLSTANVPDRYDSGRAFAKYGLSCWALRAAAISVGRKSSRWCKPDSGAVITTFVPQVSHFPPSELLPPSTCKVLRGAGIRVGPETSHGCRFRLTVLPSGRAA